MRGKKLGSGLYRNVYVCKDDPTLVIKILREPPKEKLKKFNVPKRYNANLMEWRVWQAVKDTDVAKYFCPCVRLTPEGHLIMLRCDTNIDISESEFMEIEHLKVADARTIHKKSNLGRLDGRLVILDYADHKNIRIIDKYGKERQK